MIHSSIVCGGEKNETKVQIPSLQLVIWVYFFTLIGYHQLTVRQESRREHFHAIWVTVDKLTIKSCPKSTVRYVKCILRQIKKVNIDHNSSTYCIEKIFDEDCIKSNILLAIDVFHSYLYFYA